MNDYEILVKKDVLDFAKTHWKTFLGHYNNTCARSRDTICRDRELTIHDSRAGELVASTRCYFCDETFLSQRCYATIGFLNDCRRPNSNTRVPPDLLRLTPRFEKDPKLNCEGTRDDHYCLGSRIFGIKQYTGVTDYLKVRHKEHAGFRQRREWEGSFFIAVLTGLKKCPCNQCDFPPLGRQQDGEARRRAAPDPFGGWRLIHQLNSNGELAYRTFPARTYTETDENEQLIRLVKMNGLFNVRGGVNLPMELSCCLDVQNALAILSLAGLACTSCGVKGHHASKCPLKVRGRRDDEGYCILERLKTVKQDDRGRNI